MPAEIDTDGHRVLHCDYRADCPTARPIHVSTPANNKRRIDRAYSDRRNVSSLVNIDQSSARLSENELVERKRAPKDRRRRTEKHAREVKPSHCRDGNLLSNVGRDSSASISRIDDEERRILNESDFRAKSYTLTQPSRRNRRVVGLACLASRKSPAIENVSKDERFSIAWNSQEDASVRDKVERAESRLRDQTERSRLAITDANAGNQIARRRSHQDRSWTSSRPSFWERKDFDTDPIDHTERTRAAKGAPLLSSHHSHTRSKDGSCEEDSRNVSRRFCRGEFGSDDAWASENARIDCSEPRDEQLEEQQTRRIDLANRKKIKRARRVHSFFQLVLLFLVAFGRYGTLGSTSVIKFSARSTASGLSVLGIGAIIGAVSATPIDLTGDAGTRAERSANLSHITGASRKIRMYIKNRYLQILPDTTVNGSNDDTSDYTIFQRISVSRGQLRIQGVATCLYLCMDPCGLLYGSRETTEDCVFNETIEKHNYNTYSSVRWSTPNKTLYLGLNRYGQPKKVKAKGHNLGKLSANVQVLTQGVKSEHVEALQARMMGAKHGVRHRHQNRNHHRQQSADMTSLCPTLPAQEKDGRDKFRCRKRKKRKKRKRRCRPGERPGPQCRVVEDFAASTTTEATDIDAFPEITSASSTTPESKRSCEGAASEEACRRQALSVPANKRKSRIDDDGGDRNLTINGKNKASTSNAKKPNVNIADSQSKKPDLTDGKKKKRKGPPQASRGSAMVPPSRKRYGPGMMTSSPRGASSPLTAPASEASTTTSSSSPSPPGASTAPSSERRPGSPSSGRKKSPRSSRNNVARPAGSLRVGKSFSGSADSRSRSQSTPATSVIPRNEIAHPLSTTKVPEITPFFLQSSSISPSSSLLWQESAEDYSSSLSDYSLVDESSSSTATSEFTEIVEFDASTASSEVIAEVTSFKLDEEDGGSGMADTFPRTTTRFPLERLVM